MTKSNSTNDKDLALTIVEDLEQPILELEVLAKLNDADLFGNDQAKIITQHQLIGVLLKQKITDLEEQFQEIRKAIDKTKESD